MSPKKSDEGVVIIKFCKYRKGRSSHLHILFKIGVLKYFANFIGKLLCWSLFLIKVKKADSNTGVFP